MSSKQHKLRLAGALAVLATLALAVSCKGFFVNPTLTSITVGPASPTIQTGTTGNTVQMTVTGKNDDGSQANPSVAWTITPTSVATISTTGLVTSVSTGTATVTATANQDTSVTGTQTVTVTVGCIQSITISPSSGSITSNQPTADFTATAATCNGSVPITDVATWTSSNTSLATVSNGVVTLATGATTSGSVTITAASGNIISPPITVTVTIQ